MLTTSEQNRLIELEQVIQIGLEEFQRVGVALWEIKESRLYRERYSTFNEYCETVWDLKISKANYLSQVGSVIKSLGDVDLPEKQSYAFELSIIKSDDQRQKAWSEISQYDKITKSLVQSVARKYALIEKESPIVPSVVRGLTSVQDAWDLNTMLYGEGNKTPQLPDYYVKPIEVYGIQLEQVVDPNVVRKIRWLEMFYQDEAQEILMSGYLDNGRETIPLIELQTRDIDRYKARLDYESSQQRVEVAREKQKELVKGLILDGFDIQQIEHIEGEGLVHIFPEGIYNHDTLAKMLEKAGLQTLFLVAYKGNPEINFGGNTKIRANQLNGVKPEPFMRLIKSL